MVGSVGQYQFSPDYWITTVSWDWIEVVYA